jgi:hypothetical protein
MDDRDQQISTLQLIFAQASHSPKFLQNRKFDGEAPFIAYDDVMADRCIIREGDHETIMNSFANKQNRVIASYPSIEALVYDGWLLD